MRLLVATAVAVAGLSGPAWADGHQGPKCFDKGTLDFIECPPTDPGPAPAPAPVPTVYNWAGFFLGFHAGYGALDLSGGYDLIGSALFGDDVDADGGVFGGQFGYNWVFDRIVAGLEVDGSFTDIDGSTSVGGVDPQSLDVELDAVASLRGRVGYAFDRLLPFVTAGVGIADYEVTVADQGDGQVLTDGDTAFAPVLGGGVEWGLTDNLTLRAEGLYYFIDEEYAFAEPGAAADSVDVDDFWTVRAALNFRF